MDNKLTDSRPARPGDRCSCGDPALTVFLTSKFGEVPYCGKEHPVPSDDPAAPATDEALRAMPNEDLARYAERLLSHGRKSLDLAGEIIAEGTRAVAILAERETA